jgi:ABC-type polysaccharide/polyol phosphate transport system ATPase subunit
VGSVRLEGAWVHYRPPRHVNERRRTPVWALRDVSLTIGPGQRLGIIGGNGSGKTTLLQTICGVFTPTRGRAAIRGRVASVVDLTPGPQRDLNGHENLRIEAALLRIGAAELSARYDEILDLAALPSEVLEQPLYTYSAGMLLRLRLALAVGCQPDVLVVDEVLAVADRRFQHRYLERFEALCRSGTALALASHNLDVIAEFTEEAVVLDRGQVTLAGPSREAVSSYGSALDAQVVSSASSP